MQYLYSLKSHLLVLLLIMPVFLVACSSDSSSEVPSITTTDIDGATSVDEEALNDVLDTYTPPDDLDPDETAGLIFMREEEKLARDVYLYLYARHGANVFNNISNSEQTHTDAMLSLLEKYDIADPAGSNPEGVFTDSYLQGLYDTLIAQGSASLIDGLIVGAAIEEIDLLDIQHLVNELEGNEDIAIVYENLMKGSRNHLRSFVNNLDNQGVVYQPQYLTHEEYDAVINAGMEN